MFYILNTAFDISKIIDQYPEDSIERQLLNKMSASTEKYQYDNLNQIKFELNLRREIINTAVLLNNSDFSFADFRESRCNPRYWVRTDNGGFLLRNNVTSGEAINDMFTNGSKYATECATAIVIIYYKALLNIFGEESFNKVFTNIYLMSWDVQEPLLKDVSNIKVVQDILLGDRGYFNNPDFDPATPEWRGENVIVLPNSFYFGHGIGITSADEILRDLNSRRRENATRSAYLLKLVGRPNFRKLSDTYDNTRHNLHT